MTVVRQHLLVKIVRRFHWSSTKLQRAPPFFVNGVSNIKLRRVAGQPNKVKQKSDNSPVNVVVLFELRLPRLQLVFDEVRHDVCDLNVSHLRVQVVSVDLRKQRTIEFAGRTSKAVNASLT